LLYICSKKLNINKNKYDQILNVNHRFSKVFAIINFQQTHYRQIIIGFLIGHVPSFIRNVCLNQFISSKTEVNLQIIIE
jgi:hypothetical protein